MSKFSISTGLSPRACNLLSSPFLMVPSSYHPISCYFTAEFFERVDYTWHLQFPCPLLFFGGVGRGQWPHTCHAGILVPGPGIEPMPPALGAEGLKHWTTREVPPLLFLNVSKFSFTFQQQMPQSIIPKFCVCFFDQFYIFNR